jgi:hypothetical protein
MLSEEQYQLLVEIAQQRGKPLPSLLRSRPRLGDLPIGGNALKKMLS